MSNSILYSRCCSSTQVPQNPVRLWLVPNDRSRMNASVWMISAPCRMDGRAKRTRRPTWQHCRFRSRHLYRVLRSPYLRHELRRLGSAHQRPDTVGDLLGGLAELGDGPVGGVAFGGGRMSTTPGSRSTRRLARWRRRTARRAFRRRTWRGRASRRRRSPRSGCCATGSR